MAPEIFAPESCISKLSHHLDQITNLMTLIRDINWIMLTHMPPLRRLLLKVIRRLSSPWRRIHTHPKITIVGILITPFGNRKDGRIPLRRIRILDTSSFPQTRPRVIFGMVLLISLMGAYLPCLFL